MLLNILKRFKSPVVIAAVLALVYWVLKNWFGIDIPGWNDFLGVLTAALLALGIINNPTDSKSL